MKMDLAIRFDYGRTVPWVTSNSELRAIAGSDMVVLHTKVPVHGEGMKSVAEFTVSEGETESSHSPTALHSKRSPLRSTPRSCSTQPPGSGRGG
jgi:hypothetical protein